MDVKVGITREHGRQLRLGLVVEDVAGDATMLGVSEFVTHAQRRTGTLLTSAMRLPISFLSPIVIEKWHD